MSIVVVGMPETRAEILRCARSAAAGHAVQSVSKPEDLARHEAARLVFAPANWGPSTVTALQAAKCKARVMLLDERVRAPVLKFAVASARVVGIATAPDKMPPLWELAYITRRILAPNEASPVTTDFVPWGATNVSWQPRTTAELHRIVSQIEGMAKNLGCDRREATAVSTAAHELLMNAMYDAPADANGKPMYAHDRQQSLELAAEHAPQFRFTISAEYIGLDCSDPFGLLPRKRFFEGVARGHENIERRSAPVLDTSHGGAGLGLHTLYSSGSVLRAELAPHEKTHVSWMLARRNAKVTPGRSLYFAALVNR